MATSNEKPPDVESQIAKFADLKIDPTDIDPATGYPKLPKGWVWNQFPPAEAFLEDPEWYDTTGKSVLEQRQIFSLPTASEQIEQILQLLHDFPSRGLSMLFAAAVKGNAPIVRALLDADVKGHPEAGTDDDMTLVPIHAAAFNGNLECLQILLEVGGVDVNALDELGGTALMRASWGCHPTIVKFLLEEKNADPTIRQTSNVDALEFAAGRGQLEIVKILLDHSLQAEKVDQKTPIEDKPRGITVTALALAAGADSGDVDTVRFLLDRMGYRDWNGKELIPKQREEIEGAIERAALRPHIEVIEMLLQIFFNTPLKDQSQTLGLSPKVLEAFINGMFNAVSKDNIEGLEFNWNIVFNLHSERETEKPQIANELLHRAAQHGSVSPTEILLQKYSADINFLGSGLTTPMYVASAGNHVSVMKHMFETQKENIDLHKASGKFANGPTALCIAIEKGNADAVNLLLQHGGPVEKALDLTQLSILEDEEKQNRLEVVVQRLYRMPVTLRWADNGDTEEVKHSTDEESVILNVTRADLDWLRRVETRKSDQVLVEDGSGRQLQTQ